MTDELKKLPITHCIDERSQFLGHFCAGDGKSFEQNGEYTADSCNGDSGGPLTYKNPYTNRFHLVGLGNLQMRNKLHTRRRKTTTVKALILP